MINAKVQRAEKREGSSKDSGIPEKRIQLSRKLIADVKSVCLFCDQDDEFAKLHEASTFQLDYRIRKCAEILNDTKLIWDR